MAGDGGATSLRAPGPGPSRPGVPAGSRLGVPAGGPLGAGVPELPAPLPAWCVPVPPAGCDTCPVCHGFRRRGFRLCSSCEQVSAGLAGFCPLVVPVSLAAAGRSPLYRLCRDYKNLRRPEHRRAAEAALLAALFGAFLARHGRCIARAGGGGWDGVATVPSSRPHPGHRGEHPLVEVAAAVESVAGPHLDLVRRGPGPTAHLEASDAGFVAEGAAGLRVVLLEDSYTSGARAQSAASALARAGAHVVAVVPAARLVRPAFRNGASWWEEQRRRPFDVLTCCVEDGGGAPPPLRPRRRR